IIVGLIIFIIWFMAFTTAMNYVLFGLPCLNQYYPLTSEEFLWLQPYEEGDILVFRAENEMDSLIVLQKFISSPNKMKPCNMKGLPTHKPNEFEGGGIFWLGTSPESSNSMEIVFFLEASSFHGRSVINGEKEFISVIDTSLNKILVSPIHSVNGGDRKAKVSQLVWSRENGLLSYQTSEGKIFKLDTILNIPQDLIAPHRNNN
ncbi:MAG: hypothetical protein LIO90_01370, partial [Bacteroidales bacterium]|nr:hypothetical protein [Bacteroidales bacterium]